jgi:hypothetical protein
LGRRLRKKGGKKHAFFLKKNLKHETAGPPNSKLPTPNRQSTDLLISGISQVEVDHAVILRAASSGDLVKHAARVTPAEPPRSSPLRHTESAPMPKVRSPRDRTGSRRSVGEHGGGGGNGGYGDDGDGDDAGSDSNTTTSGSDSSLSGDASLAPAAKRLAHTLGPATRLPRADRGGILGAKGPTTSPASRPEAVSSLALALRGTERARKALTRSIRGRNNAV